MKNTELQIMIHGTGLGMYDVQLSNSQGIELKSVNKFDNKNYIILYPPKMIIYPQLKQKIKTQKKISI